MRTVSRRELIQGALAAGALLALARGRGFADGVARNFRVGLGKVGGNAARGAGLGAEEARRAAGLLGVALEIGEAKGEAEVWIGERAPESTGGLVLALEPGAGGVGIFHVGSSAAVRARVLAGREDLRVVDWHPGLERFGAEQLNQRFWRRFEVPMDEAAWRGWMAVKVAAELALRGHLDRGADAGAALPGLSFDGHKGRPLKFDPGDRHLVQPVYLVDGGGRLIEEVVP